MMRLNNFGERIAVCVVLFLISSGLQAQPTTTTEGTLQILWGDPHPQHASDGAVRYELVLPNGKTRPLNMKGNENVAIHYFGQQVSVSGIQTPNLQKIPQTTNSSVISSAIEVGSISPIHKKQLQADATSGVFGTKKVIYLLLKFSDDTKIPHPPAFYTNLNNPDTPPAGEMFPSTINDFFKKTSWNQFYWLGDVGGVGGIGAPGGWITLPHPKSYYANCGWGSVCANVFSISEDGTALGRAQGINFKNYDQINFVLSNDLDCCAWGGNYYSSVDAKSYGATWEPPWGQEAGTYVHEMGHSLGLPHSGWVYYAYDSPWDMMSMRLAPSSSVCGSYESKNYNSNTISLNCTEPGNGYIAAHKDYLGWIPAANVVVTNTLSIVNANLEAGSLPLGSSKKMIKICLKGYPCSGPTARYLTIEARVKGLGISSQYDNGLSGEGIIIHEFRGDRAWPAISGSCFFNAQFGWAKPVDTTPNDFDSQNCNEGGRSYPNYALYNAQLLPGQTYTDNLNGVKIAVLSRTGSTFSVSVRGKFADAIQSMLLGDDCDSVTDTMCSN